jgi:hypothetical protein
VRRTALLTFVFVACSPAQPTETIVLTPLPPSPSASAAPTTHAHLRPLHQPIASGGDRDGDGVPDDLDKCPDEPETFNGYEDEDGCPDKKP